MKKPNFLFAFLFIGVIGTISHFIYEWTGESNIIKSFVPINESTWEHLKMLFFPFVLYMILEYFLLKNKPENYISASTIGLYTGLLSIVTLFYTYTGVLGYNIEVIDILIYYISLIISLIVRNLIIKNKKFASRTSLYISIYIIVHTAILFSWWSFNPPEIGIFTPPVV